MGCLYILHINPSLVITFANIFSHSVGCLFILSMVSFPLKKKAFNFRDFPGGAVVKNLPANAGDKGLSPGPGRSHMLWSN